MGKCFFTATLMIFLGACNAGDDQAAGGPCTYVYDTIPAKIIAIDSVGPKQRNLLVAIEEKSALKPDTIDLYATFHYYIDSEELQQKKLVVNDSVIFTSRKLISGSCNPGEVTSLVLEHFKKQY